MTNGRKPRRKSSATASWVARFRSLPPVVQALTGVLTLVSTAIALVFTLAPGLRPAGSSGPPARIVGGLKYLDLQRNVPYGVHLAADRIDDARAGPQQRARLGNIVEVSASLGGLRGRQVPLVWSIYRASGASRTPIADPGYLNQPAEPIQLASGQFVGLLDVWVPIPKAAGIYVARVLVLYRNAALQFVDSEPFPGQPSQTSAEVSQPVVGTQCKSAYARRSVKTLADPAAASIDPTPLDRTIGRLTRLVRPRALGIERTAPVEQTTYRIRARLVKEKLELNSDINLVVADPATGQTMDVRFPADGCTVHASPANRAAMSSARAALLQACGLPEADPSSAGYVRLHGTATITGVGFFNFLHGVSGQAPNAIELHPVTGFDSPDCRGG